jgi:CD109 antigen
VTLPSSSLFQVREENDVQAVTKTATSVIQVPSNDAASAYFWIVPGALGHISIEVSATSSTAADAAQFTLLVIPEGVPQEYSTSVLFSVSAGQTQSNTLSVSRPPDGVLVPGSLYATVTVIGDLMGQSLNGLGDLLQMPYGCGEQNMLNFAPDVYILKYLTIKGQATGSIADSARKFLNAGYQKELTFQRSDGSFSAFGNSDPAGSVWLSSFVAKCFHEARQFIPVDESKITPTLEWVMSNQSDSGSFHEPPSGRVIHTDMQGGSAGGVALTAYVLIALLENSDNSLVNQAEFSSARINAVRYLVSQLSAASSDPYALSIITFALTLANSSSADTAFQQLNALAIAKDGMRYWHKTTGSDTSSANGGLWSCQYQQARSVDIEMTGYALLTYAQRKNVSGGIPIAKWIVSHRNSLGGFSSTQDTVVALQALAAFAALTSGSSGAQNLHITLTADTLTHLFTTITHVNALVLQSVQIPSTATNVQLQASGSGFGLVQLNVKYNIYVTDNKARRKRDTSAAQSATNVELTVDETQTDSKHMTVRACARYTGSTASGMSIISVGLPTGYTVENSDQIQSQSTVIRKVETDTSSVTVYLDQLVVNWTCVTVNLYKSLMIDNVQPATVTAYLYYDRGQSDTLTYQPPSANVTFCDQCPQCCSCPAESCGPTSRPTSSVPNLLPTSHLLLALLAVALAAKFHQR